MFLPILNIVILFAAAATTGLAAYSDWRHYKIPNYFSLILILLYPAFILTSPVETNWVYSLIVGLITFIVGFSLFAAGLFGGGDVKLITALSLWAGTSFILTFLVSMVLAGGVLVFVVIIREALRQMDETSGFFKGARAAIRTKTPVPYGVAIAAGSLPFFVFFIKNSSFVG
ncbi:A24 family peptidase [Sneathiella glossodoripedis]|uniref:A24 family peptidase n=1 Tax=Sneathiella glossodoripedis TaxID=418853 RepID=UPI00046F3497|nr:prepilin peptidase [Sneathiella glossodoripedis]